MKMSTAIFTVLSVQALMFVSLSMIDFQESANTLINPIQSLKKDEIAVATALRRSFSVDVKTVGDMEALNSISVSSYIRGDQAKIIDIVADGVLVKEGDILAKIDSTPFEKRIIELKTKILEKEGKISSLYQAIESEKSQADHDTKTAQFEIEAAEMEINKLLKGDGPLETARLKSALSKAEAKYNEINAYVQDLENLEKEGFLLPSEVAQTKKKIEEEKEHFESAKLQYQTYVEHVFPMVLKKGETHLKRMLSQKEETEKVGLMSVKKAQSAYEQAVLELDEIKKQLQDAQYDLLMTDIKAPASGMVVLKEEFRASNEKRKPRIGDFIIRNQALLDLPDLSKMIVKTKIREIDLHKIDLNKQVTIEVDAYPHMKFQGQVFFIGVLAINDIMRLSDEKSFEVKILVEQVDPRLRPGMTARATIHAGKVEDAISVPVHSIFEEDKEYYCYVQSGSAYKKQHVTLGTSNDHFVEILDGLDEYMDVCLVKPNDEDIFY